jgi:hypothetical protein
LWWGQLQEARAQTQIDHLGAGSLATDWGARLVSRDSALYDPLSYHHGSVWPLFTGWASMAAYRYGRPHVGYQALRANADLRSASALGYITELLSGDYLSAFGRSSHHQVWSEAMVATPLVRGLLGLTVEDGGRSVRFAPQLPADWDRVSATGLPVGKDRIDLSLVRGDGQDTVTFEAKAIAPLRLVIAPAYPLDAEIESVSVDGRPAKLALERQGDVQRPRVVVEAAGARAEIVVRYRSGTDAYLPPVPLEAGARSTGVRVLRSRAEADGLRLLLEGLGGRSYPVRVRSSRRVSGASGVEVRADGPRDFVADVRFEGSPEAYVRREVVLPLGPREP